MDQSAQSVPSGDGVSGGGEGLNIRASLGRKQVGSSVWSLSVVMIDIDLEHRPQVAFVQDEEPVEALGSFARSGRSASTTFSL